LLLVAGLLLQGCATTSAPKTGYIRDLPATRISFEAPELRALPRGAVTPGLNQLLSRGSRAMGQVLRQALSFTGVRYRYGGSSPVTGFDCSGFVGYVFRESAGLKLPRASRDMATVDGRKLTRSELRPGDLVFFAHRSRVDHVGIYLGEDRFIHSPSTGGRVRTDELSDRYWGRRFVNGKRVLEADAVADATSMGHTIRATTAAGSPGPSVAGGTESGTTVLGAPAGGSAQ